LRTLDDGLAQLSARAESMAAARATQGPRSEAEISREHLLLRVDPRISYVSDTFAQGNPGFWRGTGNTQ
jgi:hypothetical protein